MVRRNRIVLLCALCAIATACNGDKRAERDRVARRTTHGAAYADTIPPLPSPPPAGEWRMPNYDYQVTRYSPLTTINTRNVAQLKVATTLSTGVPHGHEGSPLVVNNTMYVVTPYPNVLLAIDLTVPGGGLKWKYEPHPDPRSVGIACCDVVNRGPVYADGKIIFNTLDAHTIAVDANTGAEVWNTTVGNIDLGETMTGAPLVIRDKVIVGNSGAELGVRGYVAALDLGSGKQIWRAFNTGPDKDVKIGADFHSYYPKDNGHDLGVSTWPQGQWKLGGGTVWGWFSYDPEQNLLFYGTSNPGVWNPDLRLGDNKWSLSIMARNPDDGSLKWAYQITPHDEWDYDEIMENMLLDLPVNGRMRKLLVHPGRNGFVFVLDRTNGQLLSAEKFVESTNWATRYDLRTGLPVRNPAMATHDGVVTRGICPSSTGAKEFVPSAFSPRTRLLYIPAHNTCMDYEGVEANYIAGTPYLGASVKMYPGPGTGGDQGELIAWDPVNARKVWSTRYKFPVYSGVLATGGDLIFYGTMDGWFIAADARTGTVLWKFKTGSGIVGNPMTYIGPDGRQYVAVYSGIGGWMGAVAFPSLSTDDPYAALGVVGAMKDIKKYSGPGDVLYVFGL